MWKIIEYFASKEKVKNWFDEEKEEEKPNEGFLSLDSTMAEVEATEAGKALLDKMMQAMQQNMAGGMGKNVKIPKAMQLIVARQPLKKLLAQAGVDVNSEQAKQLAAALSRIPKKK